MPTADAPDMIILTPDDLAWPDAAPIWATAVEVDPDCLVWMREIELPGLDGQPTLILRLEQIIPTGEAAYELRLVAGFGGQPAAWLQHDLYNLRDLAISLVTATDVITPKEA